MSSFLPSLKWPTSSFESRGSPPEDAPLSSLPPAERVALDTLITLATPLITSPPHALPRSDPWTKLSVDDCLRDRVLLRLLRFNSLSPPRTLRQLRAILEWRATARIAEEPHDAMRGMAAGIPITLLPPVGKGGARLFFAPAEKYEKKDVQRAAQEVGVARMFEYMLYDVDGPQAERCAVVVDFTGFSAKNMDLAGIKTGVYTYINYYPDVFHAILLINYPKFMYGVWRIIRPLLDERTANRVHFLSDGASLRAELEGAFTKGQIPPWLHGTAGSEDATLELLNGVRIDTAALAGRFL